MLVGVGCGLMVARLVVRLVEAGLRRCAGVLVLVGWVLLAVSEVPRAAHTLVMADSVVEIVWGLHFAGLVASCSDCDASHRVTDRAEFGRVGAWAREPWLMEHPWAVRAIVVHGIEWRWRESSDLGVARNTRRHGARVFRATVMRRYRWRLREDAGTPKVSRHGTLEV